MEDWKSELDTHFKETKQAKKDLKEQHEKLQKSAKLFFKKVVIPALEEISEELANYKRKASIDSRKEWASLMVRHNKKKEFIYEIKLGAEGDQLLASRSFYSPNDKGKLKLVLEGKIHTTENSARIEKIERTDIMSDFLESYKQATRP